MTEYLHFSASCAKAVHALSFRFYLVSSGEQNILEGLHCDNAVSLIVFIIITTKCYLWG